MKLRPPVPLNLIGIEAFRIFLSKLQPVNGSREIWFKLGHNRFFVGEYDRTGNFDFASTKLIDRNDPTSRIKTTIYPESHLFIAKWCEVNNGGAFFLPSQPQGLPLKNNVLVSDDIPVELDNGSLEAQWNLIWEFIQISGLKPSYLLHSAGKSYHGHWKTIDHLPIEQTIRLRKLLAIALHSDPAVINPHQPMRLPGFYRKEKGQYQALSYHSDSRYTLEEIDAGFAKFYEHRGLPFPEILTDKQWQQCRRVITWDKEISDRTYQKLVGFGYQLPEVIEEKQLSVNTKTLVLFEEIGADVKNRELRRVLSDCNGKIKKGFNIYVSNKRSQSLENNSVRSLFCSTSNPWVEFYQDRIIPSIVSLESAFDLYPHNFLPNGVNRYDGDPGYRSSHGGRSFTVSWWNGQPVYRDWLEAESGDLVKYYWRFQGYSGYPRGKDYIDMVCAIADRHKIPIPKELTKSYDEPDEREYQEYLEWEKEQELVEVLHADLSFLSDLNEKFLTWFKAQKKQLSKKFKGFGITRKENPEIEAPESFEYLPGNPLPPPELYIDREPPIIKFKSGERLQLLAQLKQLGWKRILDRSPTGTGKSYDAGKISPLPDDSNKVWYLDPNHRNVSTEIVRERKTDLNPRHNGLYYSFNGLLCVAKNQHQREQAVTLGNCHLADLFITAKEKGHDYFENDDGTIAPNPICGRCKYNQMRAKDDDGKELKKVSLCAGARGKGYGYRYERKQTLAQREIRADIRSLPNPQTEDSIGDKSYDYSDDICFIEEASNTISGVKTLFVKLKDYDRLMMDLHRKCPELFNLLQPFLVVIRDLLDGIISNNIGSRFGLEHQDLVSLLSINSTIADDIITEVSNHRLKVSELIVTPQNQVDVKSVPKRWRKNAYLANCFDRETAWLETLENFNNLHSNWLLPLLKILSGNPGSLRFKKNGKQLIITTHDTRSTQILKAMGMVVLLDATGNKAKLAKVIDCDVNEIIEIQQITAPLKNLTVINVEMPGLGSNQWSKSAIARIQKLTTYLKEKDSDLAVLALKKYAIELGADGYWWRDNRGSNKLLGKRSISAFGTPQPDLGATKDEYLTLFGTLDGFDDYYQSLIEAEFIQLIGRPRAHLFPDRSFTVYAIATDLDLDFLLQLGCEVQKRDVAELCPEAAGSRSRDKHRLFNFCLALHQAGEKITQQGIASGLNVSQAWISMLFKDENISWRDFVKLLQPLLKSNIGLLLKSQKSKVKGQNLSQKC